MSQATILVVDDEPEIRELLSMRLERHGYVVETASDGAGAFELLGKTQVHAIVLDLRLARESGLDVLDRLRVRYPEVPVVMLTAHATVTAAVDAMQRGAYGFLTKPFHDHELLQKLAHAVERGQLGREVAGLRRAVGDPTAARMLGASPAIEAVRELLARVAPTDATVLVLGESGTGKELAARELHARSNRANGPFVSINCGALPAELLESELFGHVRGAFTGAVRDRPGLFASGRGGTVFLDEIAEADASVQVRLLRVLQERRFSPVGSNVEEQTDARVVAATNRELRREVAEGRFREDLFYRLHVVPIALPPLRDRGGDVALLAEVFLARAAERHHMPVPRLDPDAAALLLAHDWPGNVRELGNAMEGALLFARDGVIRVADLERLIGSTMGGDAEAEKPGFATDLLSGDVFPTFREARDAFDRAYLAEALRRCDGNVSAAARLAGRNRTDFHDLMRKYGLGKR